jgi:IclR family acetate operon transcriptional repressor
VDFQRQLAANEGKAVTGATTGAGSPRPVQRENAVRKMLLVLEAVCERATPIRLASVVRQTGLNKTTVYRILGDLEANRYVVHHPDGTYSRGPGVLALAAVLSPRDEIDDTQRVLRELHEQAGQTIHLAIRSGDFAIYTHKIEPRDQTVRLVSTVGMRLELHSTAIGKSILSLLSENDLRAYAERTGLPAHTVRTVTDVAELLRVLKEVRDAGYAIDDRENEDAVRCIGAPIVDPAGVPIGGVSISTVAPLVEKDALLAQVPNLLRAAVRISELFW